ncbi:MAG: aromatic ring-hydroxylating oxygenase subunit alpha [Pseudomonadales bacterium]
MRHDQQVRILKELMRQLDHGVNADAGGLRKNPVSAYTCPELAEKEWLSFFRGYPQVLGFSGDLPEPGTFITNNDLGIPILATRDDSGRFRAFLNSCRHRGPMVESRRRGVANRFSCPFHAWTYRSDGSLTSVPMAEHFGAFDHSCHSLIELPSLERFGFLVVHTDPHAAIDAEALFAGLEDDLASWGWENLIHGADDTIDMRLNWKLATDTFGETYHFKRLHKNTLAQTFYGDVLSYESYARNHRMVLCLKAIDSLREQPEAQWHLLTGGFPVYFLYPNVLLNVGQSGVTMVRVYPDPNNVGRSISQVGYYFTPEAKAQNLITPQQRGLGFSEVVADEDYATAETTQVALSSGLQDYVLFGRNEPPLHHYHNTFRRELGMAELPLLQEGEC